MPGPPKMASTSSTVTSPCVGPTGCGTQASSITRFFKAQPVASAAPPAGIRGFFKKLPVMENVQAAKPCLLSGKVGQAGCGKAASSPQPPVTLDDSLTDFEMDMDTPEKKNSVKHNKREAVKASRSLKQEQLKKHKAAIEKCENEIVNIGKNKLKKNRNTKTKKVNLKEENVVEVTSNDTFSNGIISNQCDINLTGNDCDDEGSTGCDMEVISYEAFLNQSAEEEDSEVGELSAQTAPGRSAQTVDDSSCSAADRVKGIDGRGSVFSTLGNNTPVIESVKDIDDKGSVFSTAGNNTPVIESVKDIDDKGSVFSNAGNNTPVCVIEDDSQDIPPVSDRAILSTGQKSGGKIKSGKGTKKPKNPFHNMMASRANQKPLILPAEEPEQVEISGEPDVPDSPDTPKKTAITNFFSSAPRVLPSEKKKGKAVVTVAAEVYGSPKKSICRRKSLSPESAMLRESVSKTNVVVECTKDDIKITDLGSSPITPKKKSRKQAPTASIFDIAARKKVAFESAERKEQSSDVVKATEHKNNPESCTEEVIIIKEDMKTSGEMTKVDPEIPCQSRKSQPVSGKSDKTPPDQAEIKSERTALTDMERQVRAAQLAALDKVAVPKKATAQATLSFGGQLVRSSPIPAQSGVQNEGSKKPATKKRTTKVIPEIAEEVKGNVKSRSTMKKRGGVKKKVESTSESPELSVLEGPHKRALRSVYKITPLKPPRKSTRGLKLKFTRVKEMAVEEDSAFENNTKTASVNVARQLLHKARNKSKKKISPAAVISKKSSPPKKSVPKSSAKKRGSRPSSSSGEEMKTVRGSSSSSGEDSGRTLRRSSRASSQAAKFAISECMEGPCKENAGRISEPQSGKEPENEEDQTPKKSKKDRKSTKKLSDKTPQKETKIAGNMPHKAQGKTPKKTPKKGAKLASIFLGKSAKASSHDDDDDDVEVLAVDIDPELARVRRQFLLSGVPETLRRQQHLSVASGEASDYPPLPTVSHVQQSAADVHTSSCDPWQLTDVTLPLQEAHAGELDLTTLALPSRGEFTSCSQEETGKTSQRTQVDQQPKVPVEDWSEEIELYLLAEVHLHNPGFPVRQVYKQLQGKQDDRLEPGKAGDDVQEGSAGNTGKAVEEKANKRSRKRKLASDGEVVPMRRSKRRRESAEVVIFDGSPPKETSTSGQDGPETQGSDSSKMEECCVPELQWTEKYAPSCRSEILSNSKCASRLRCWLTEWKQRTDLEARRLKKQLLKQAKKQNKSKEDMKKDLGAEWWTDDDSDFDLDTSDSEVDESRLCNTMLLTGPHGAGKSAMVYALAQELGYKVFEVNASSRRAGRKILAQLQEATQSHQVNKSNLDNMFTTFMVSAQKSSPDKSKPEKKMPAAFSNFFKKSGVPDTKTAASKGSKGKGSVKAKPTTPPKAKKKSAATCLFGGKTSSMQPSQDVSQKGLQLSSTSLIFFEEVDVVFEEDKGFWAAIQTFMSSTKRPIILTAASSHLDKQLDGKHETLKIRRPQMSNLVSYLQLVCLAEKHRVSHADLSALVEHMGGDLRRAILTLQWWLLSGADRKPLNTSIKYSQKFFEPGQSNKNAPCTITPSKPSPAKSRLTMQCAEDSGDEFQSLKRSVRRRARVIMDDESSMEGFQSSPQKLEHLPAVCEDGQDSPVIEEDSQDPSCQESPDLLHLSVAPITAPPQHTGCYEAITGCLPPGSQHPAVLKCLSAASAIPSCCVHTFSACLSLGHEVLYAHLPHLLHLPRTQFTPSVRLSLPAPPPEEILPTKHRRVKVMDDIYDSEQSEDESAAQTKSDDKELCPEGPSEAAPAAPPPRKPVTVSQRLASSATQSLAELYEDLSYIDAYIRPDLSPYQEGICDSGQGSVSAGLSLDMRTWDEEQWWKREHAADMMANIQLRSVARTNSHLSRVMSHVDTLEKGQKAAARQCLQLPVGREDINLVAVRREQECSHLRSMCSGNQRAMEGVSTLLPSHHHCAHHALTTDTMPYIRAICQAEEVRKVNNTKRRFMHYCDQISLNITRKTAILQTLNWTFH